MENISINKYTQVNRRTIKLLNSSYASDYLRTFLSYTRNISNNQSTFTSFQDSHIDLSKEELIKSTQGKKLKSHFFIIYQSIIKQNNHNYNDNSITFNSLLKSLYIRKLLLEQLKLFKNISLSKNIDYEKLCNSFFYNCNQVIMSKEANSSLKVSQSPSKRKIFKFNTIANELTRQATEASIKNHDKEKILDDANNIIANTMNENLKQKKRKELENIVKVKHKLNIYISDYETLNSRPCEPCEQIRVYEGNLLTTNYLKYNPSLLYHEKIATVNVSDLICKSSNVKSLFLPNDNKIAYNKIISKEDQLLRKKSYKKFMNGSVSMTKITNKNNEETSHSKLFYRYKHKKRKTYVTNTTVISTNVPSIYTKTHYSRPMTSLTNYGRNFTNESIHDIRKTK